MLIDIGVNLTNHQFNGDRDDVIERAKSAGVGAMMLTGTSTGESRAAFELASAHPGYMYSTAGIHPHDASTYDDDSLSVLEELARQEAVVAVGECGLDFNRNYSSPEDQVRCFRAQLALATELDMPLFLHERDATEAFLDVIDPFLPTLVGGVVHCFTGDEQALQAYLSRGFHIGITGWVCDERRGVDLAKIVHQIPLNRILIETDAPYLLPRNLSPKPKGRRNEPCYLPAVVETLAHHMGVSPSRLAAASTENAVALFQLSAHSVQR